METGDDYRIKAADLAASARAERLPFLKHEFEQLALFYLRLADQADRRGSYSATTHDAPPILQQQQPQPTSDIKK
jgi:hypothetical protein